MGFLASFYGSQAQSHQETTQDWKRLWQEDQDRELRERQLKSQEEQAARQHNLQRAQLRESTRQFNISEELDRLKLDLDERRVDQTYADGLLGRIMPLFTSADYVRQGMIVDQLSDSAGDNQLLAPAIATMRGSITTSDLDMGAARSIIGAVLDPTAHINEFGFAPNISEWEIESALKVFEGTRDYGWLREEVENTLTERETTLDYINSNAMRRLGLKTEIDEANLEAARVGTELTQANIEDLTERTRIMTAMSEDTIRAAKYEADILGIDLSDRKVMQEFLRDSLTADLELVQEQVRAASGSNDLFEELYDTYVQTALKELDALNIQTDMLESDLRVLLATEAPRIYRETLQNKQLQASIDQIHHNIQHDKDLRQDALMTLGFNLAAEGHTTLLSEFWDQLFPDSLADRERTMELVTEFSAGIEGENKLKAAAQLAYTYAQTENMVMSTSLMPRQVAVQEGHLALGYAQLAHQQMDSQRRYLLEEAKNRGTPMTALNALDAVSDVYGSSHDDVMGHIDGALQAAANLEAIQNFANNVQEGAVVDSTNLSTLEAYYSSMGLGVPELGAPVNLAGLGDYVEQMTARTELIISDAESRASLLYSRTAELSEEPIGDIATFYGRVYDPSGDAIIDAMFNNMLSSGPAANAFRQYNEAEAAAMVNSTPEIFGGNEYLDLGKAGAVRQVLISMVPDPVMLANLDDSVLESMWENLTNGEISKLAGAFPNEQHATFEALGIDTFEGFKSALWQANGYMDQHVNTIEFISSAISMPIPPVSASLFSGEGQAEQLSAFYDVAARAGGALSAIQEGGFLDPMYRGTSTAEANQRLGELSDLLGLDVQTMQQRGLIRPYSTDSPSVPNSERGDRYIPDSQAIIEFLDQQLLRAMQGVGAVDELGLGVQPSGLLGW